MRNIRLLIRANQPGPASAAFKTINLAKFSMKRWEYKHIRLDYIGRGITQEINLLDVDGERLQGWGDTKKMPPLHELLAALGADGWEMMSHVVNQDNKANGVTFHYYNFKREVI